MLRRVCMYLVQLLISTGLYFIDWNLYYAFCSVVMGVMLMLMVFYLGILVIGVDSRTMKARPGDAQNATDSIVDAVACCFACVLPALICGFPRLPEGLMGVL